MWVKIFLVSLFQFSATGVLSSSWTNGKFSTERTEVVALGEELSLGCKILPQYGSQWGKCQWMSPSGSIWTVSGDVVVDDAGNVIDGVTGHTVGQGDCGIVIDYTIEEYLGDWRCRYLEEDIKYELVIATENQVKDFRLPQTFDVQHYEILLIPDYESTKNNIKFAGYSEMFVVSLIDTDMFTFHAHEITPTEVKVNYSTVEGNLNVSEIHFDLQRMFVHIKLNDVFVSGEGYAVRVNFAADTVREGNYTTYGFYPQVCYQDTSKLCWFTQFESTYARTAFPCLDEPSFKAIWDLQIFHPDHYHARTNYPLLETVSLPDKPGYVLDIFGPSGPPMSSYLVAVAITDYTSLPSGDNSTTVWAPLEELDAGRGDFANEIGPELMSYYEDYFKAGYPLAKQDLMYAANKPGYGMENWGLVLFAPNCLMVDKNGTQEEKWNIINVVAHELAHQWFGNLVTLDWWGQTWLNEGFAIFVSYIGAEHVDLSPTVHPWARFYVDEVQRVMKSDQDPDKHWPITDETLVHQDIQRMFGEFSYQKGGSIVGMMESILTKPTFTKGLINYLFLMRYSSVTEDDLFEHLEAAAVEDDKWPATNKPFSEVMKSWTNQAGLPLVYASILDNGNMYLNQTWLVNSGKPTEERLWHIPITLTSVEETPSLGWENKEPYTWLWQNEVEMELVINDLIPENVPFIVNVQGSGYYRVNYDDRNWRKLAEVLRTNKDWIHPLNRAQIICDVAALADIGYVNEDIKNDILSYFENETEFGPVHAYQQCIGSTDQN